MRTTPPYLGAAARHARRQLDVMSVGLHHELKTILEDRLTGRITQEVAVATYRESLSQAVNEVAGLTVDYTDPAADPGAGGEGA